MPMCQIRRYRDPYLLDVYETVADEFMAGSYWTVILEVITERKTVLGLVVGCLSAKG